MAYSLKDLFVWEMIPAEDVAYLEAKGFKISTVLMEKTVERPVLAVLTGKMGSRNIVLDIWASGGPSKFTPGSTIGLGEFGPLRVEMLKQFGKCSLGVYFNGNGTFSPQSLGPLVEKDAAAMSTYVQKWGYIATPVLGRGHHAQIMDAFKKAGSEVYMFPSGTPVASLVAALA